MSEVRQAFRYNTFVSTTKPHAVLLFVTMHSFFSIHRTWCNSFASTTQFKASCTLVLLPDTPSHKNVFTEVLTREPCTHNLLLLSDKAKIGSSFFTRLKGTPSNKVTCLAATDNRVYTARHDLGRKRPADRGVWYASQPEDGGAEQMPFLSHCCFTQKDQFYQDGLGSNI